MLQVEEHEYMYELSIPSLVSLSVNLFKKKKKHFLEKKVLITMTYGGEGVWRAVQAQVKKATAAAYRPAKPSYTMAEKKVGEERASNDLTISRLPWVKATIHSSMFAVNVSKWN